VDPSTHTEAPEQFPRDLEWILPASSYKDKKTNTNATLLFDYSTDDSLKEEISRCMQQSIQTAFLCRCHQDALELASGVAQLMDDSGGGKYLYILGQDSDSIVQLCEELSYLDVTGPTMKSRIIVDLVQTNDESQSEEAVEECLLMGVNKFAVQEDQLSWLGQLVEDQGKTCTFQND
jgi:hypothetical protein